MSKNMGTVEDIIKEMREVAKAYFAGGNGSASVYEMLSSYADRMDAAYKRDLQSMVDAGEIDMRTAMDEVTKLREENERLTDALARVVGCADSTCGGMGVCRTCSAAQYFGVAK